MATSENTNQTGGAQSNSNNSTGSGNWYFSDGKWQSSEGNSLSGGAGGAGFGGGAGGAGFGGGAGGAGGASFGGGATTTTTDGQYNYERPLDERELTNTNNPFGQLISVVGGDTSSLGSGGNPLASSGSGSSGDGSSNSGGSSNALAGGEIPGNLPFGNTPPSQESASNLPETGNGLPVPYNSDNWTDSLNNIDSSASATGNTSNGNGNWYLGSNNTTDGNGNWNFSDGNTTSGNGNWNYGSDNAGSGNGNWNFGSGNDILGNANMGTGSGNTIAGNGNTSDVSNSSLLGNRIEASGEGQTLIGNEGWNFAVSGDSASNQVSLGSSTPSSEIGFGITSNVSSLLSSPNLAESAMSNPGYNNPNYDYSATV